MSHMVNVLVKAVVPLLSIPKEHTLILSEKSLIPRYWDIQRFHYLLISKHPKVWHNGCVIWKGDLRAGAQTLAPPVTFDPGLPQNLQNNDSPQGLKVTVSWLISLDAQQVKKMPLFKP